MAAKKGNPKPGAPAASSQSAPLPTPQQQYNPNQMQMPTAPSGRGFMVLIGIIVVAVVLYFVWATGALSGIGAPGAGSKLISILSQKSVNTTQLAQVTAQQINSVSVINVSYSGRAVINGTGGSLGGIVITIPFTLTYQKYYNQSRLGMSAKGIPILGNFSTISIMINKTVGYSCTNSSISLMGSKNGYTCTKTTADSQSPTSLNFSKYAVISKNLTMKYLGTRNAAGQQCAFVNGTMNVTSLTSVPGLSGTGSDSKTVVNFAACLSLNYYIPLNITITAKGSTQGSVTLTAQASYLNTNVNSTALVALPGPISNSTFDVGGSYPTPTTIGYGGYGSTSVTTSTVGYGYTTSTAAALSSCNGFTLWDRNSYNTTMQQCTWTGGNLTVTYESGHSSNVAFSIVGADGITYVSSSGSASICLNTFSRVYLPAQTYTVIETTGSDLGSGVQCYASTIELSS